eukprot:scaffold104252_cov61-Phaeocystis_antarctica.AAC.7
MRGALLAALLGRSRGAALAPMGWCETQPAETLPVACSSDWKRLPRDSSVCRGFCLSILGV